MCFCLIQKNVARGYWLVSSVLSHKCISWKWKTGLQPLCILIWREFKTLVISSPIKNTLAVRHLPDTQESFLTDIVLLLKTNQKMNVRLIIYRPAVNMHITYNYSISLLPAMSLLAWWCALYNTAPAVKRPWKSLMSCALLRPSGYRSSLQLI